MKQFLFLCIWLITLGARAAVPTFESFSTNQFQTNSLQIFYRDPHTNDAGIIYPALDNTLTLVTNLNAYGTFSLPAKVTLLTLGTNYIDLSTNTTLLLNSPTNDAAQVILSLSAGAYQGQLLLITSQNGSNSFTLPDLSEQWDVPGAYVDIAGDWIATTNRGVLLQYTAPDWIELHRSDPSQTGGGTIFGSGTAGFLPYWLNATTLADSPLQRSGASSVQISQGGGFFQAGVGSGVPFLSGNSFLQISAGTGVLLMNGGSYLTPESGGVGIVLGTGTNYFGGLFLGTNGLHGEYTDDGSQLLRNGVPFAGGAALWASGGGILQPSPAIDLVRIESQLADNATNVALVVDTSVPWTTGAFLAAFANKGTNVAVISPYGGIGIGASVVNFGGPQQNSQVLDALHVTSLGDSEDMTLRFDVTDDSNYYNDALLRWATGFVVNTVTNIYQVWMMDGYTTNQHSHWEIAGYAGDDVSSGLLGVDSSLFWADKTFAKRLYLRPEVISTGSATAYTFDTANTLIPGDNLAAFANSGTNQLTIGPTGGTIIGKEPSFWSPFGPSLVMFSHTGHGYDGSWEILIGGGNDSSNATVNAYGDYKSINMLVDVGNSYVDSYADANSKIAAIEIQCDSTKRTFITPGTVSGSASGGAYYFDTANALVGATDKLQAWYNHGTIKTSISKDGALTVGSVTKAQKTALTPADGMIVYQTDNTPGFRGYVNGTWFIFSMAADP